MEMQGAEVLGEEEVAAFVCRGLEYGEGEVKVELELELEA